MYDICVANPIAKELPRRGSIPVYIVLWKSVRIFKVKKKLIDMYIYISLIKLNCKLNLENSFYVYFLFILFLAKLPEIDMDFGKIIRRFASFHPGRMELAIT